LQVNTGRRVAADDVAFGRIIDSVAIGSDDIIASIEDPNPATRVGSNRRAIRSHTDVIRLNLDLIAKNSQTTKRPIRNR
jgi:hypothetical protein